MRDGRIGRGYIPFLCMLFLSGCMTAPTMSLKHDATIDATYATKGALRIDNFRDDRPANEKVASRRSFFLFFFGIPQILSGRTSPELLPFFQRVLEVEAKKTRLFRIGDGDYTLSGCVSSLKVDEAHLSFYPYIAAYSKWTATAVFHATLSKSGQVILKKEVSHAKTLRRWWSPMIWVSQILLWVRPSALLDETMTESIKILFDDINRQIK